MADYVVGLTGGVASGKSEVTRRFEALGITVADADLAARDAVAIGSEGLAEVVAAFGSEALAADGSLDRPAMRRRVFADDAARLRLEAIVHPRVRALLQATCAAAPGPYAVAAIPLLAEVLPAAPMAAIPSPAAATQPPPATMAMSGPAPAHSFGAGAGAVADAPAAVRDGGAHAVTGTGRDAYPWLRRVLVIDVPVAVQRARLLARDGIDAALAERMIAAQASRVQRLAIADDVLVNDGPLDALDAHVAALDARYRALAAAAAPG
ncbi:dephospho-CoA kinase [Luteimonas kalidii]|uniref:Dephospho-CoA kinase n=1 Tax=Luteimonas kalidii TaxID=3042025 RepID=A0ABT6JQT8_9GAMM|nr:dephospho-CoA kinase [Luteimonas kalidii]MDH5833030.1 dephospho-CoA kinase [Luteimonas kalidii]